MDDFTIDNVSDIVMQLPVDIKNTKISLLVPYYNESQIIIKNIHYINQKLLEWGFDFEIIASDDGSQDYGYELLTKEFYNNPNIKLVRSPRNYGKGRALMTAYEKSIGELILFIDCDLELPIELLPYFLLTMYQKQVDVVIGSKEDPASNINYPLIRKILSRGYSLINKIFFHLSIRDTQTGIKLFKRSILEHTLPYLLVKSFAFDIELLALCQYKGYSIVSHPIVLKYTRENAIGRISLNTILHMFKDTLAVFWRLQNKLWDNIQLGKGNFKYIIISFDPEDQGKENYIFIENKQNIVSSILQCKDYDICIFKEKGTEIPVFAQDILNRIFIDSQIQAILPLELSIGQSKKEELFYHLFGNIFFQYGYYEQYTLIKQDKLPIDCDNKFALTGLVYRKELLENIISTYQDGFVTIQDISSIIHTPFYFIHKHFPENIKELYQVIDRYPTKLVGLKKKLQLLSLSLILLAIFAIWFENILFIIPWCLLEISIWIWYIYSLGIKKGISYIGLFIWIRILDPVIKVKKYFISIINNTIRKI